jgi:hypothetical protein
VNVLLLNVLRVILHEINNKTKSKTHYTYTYYCTEKKKQRHSQKLLFMPPPRLNNTNALLNTMCIWLRLCKDIFMRRGVRQRRNKGRLRWRRSRITRPLYPFWFIFIVFLFFLFIKSFCFVPSVNYCLRVSQWDYTWFYAVYVWLRPQKSRKENVVYI